MAKSWLVAIILKLVVIGAILSRQDVFTAYGTGSGVNKAHISPYTIVTTALFNDKKGRHFAIRKSNEQVAIAMEATFKNLAVVGEVINDLQDDRKREKLIKAVKEGKFDKVVSKSKKWFDKTKNNKVLSKIVFGGNESNLVVISTIFAVVSMFSVIVHATSGSYLLLFGLAGTYAALILMNLPNLTLTPFGLAIGATLLTLNALN